MLETASIAGGATIAVFLVVIVCVVVYLQYKRYNKVIRAGSDCVDGHTTPVAVQEAGDSKEVGWNVIRSQRYTLPINRDVCSA
jgi:hypothetical protein